MNQKAMETKLFELQSEKNTFEHRMLLDETKFRELCQRLNDSQVRKRKKKKFIKKNKYESFIMFFF